MLITRERGGNRERRKRGNLCIFLFCSHSPPTAYKRERGIGEGRGKGERKGSYNYMQKRWNEIHQQMSVFAFQDKFFLTNF